MLDQHTPSTPIALAIESCGYQCKTTQWGQLMSSTAHLSDTLVIAQLEMSVQQLEYITHHIDCTNHATLIMLTRGDDATIESLVNADVSLLHVGPLSHERIPSLLKVAMARHTSSLRKQQHVKQLQDPMWIPCIKTIVFNVFLLIFRELRKYITYRLSLLNPTTQHQLWEWVVL